MLRPSTAARTARPMSRAKADTLLLLFACALILAPHALHLPLWITGLCLALMAWRGWITFRGNRMPPRWLLLPIALLAMAGVYLTFKTFFGQETGVAMLVLLLTFKLLEMHAGRDLFVVVFLSFFLLLTTFFYSQTIATALLMIAAVITMLTAQLSFQYTEAVPPLRKRLRLGAGIFALAVPLTIALFFLFPRIQGPLWGMPADANTGRSGLSDTMEPGNISKLALSEEVAFRVKFIDPAPDNSKLYWRGIVLGQYDGRSWTRLPFRGAVSQPIMWAPRGTPVRYQVTQEANMRRWLFALELPEAAPLLTNNRTGFSPDFQLVSERPISTRVRYEVTSYLDYDLQAQESAVSLRDWLNLPVGYNPNTLAFALEMRKQSANDLAAVNEVLKFFRREKFSYTLQPPLLGRNGVDEFLFSTRAGFCEHYAGAFVVMMRAMNIPARVVTGYQGGQMNPVDGFMTVKQSDAHAWAEVWIAPRGWIRVDPTAAVAPQRIERNSSAGSANAFGGLINMNMGADSWLRKIRFSWEAVNNGWNQWVLNYTPDRQKSLLQSLGFGNIDWRTMTALMFAIGGVLTLLIAFLLLANRKETDPLDAAYAKLGKQMTQLGYPRHLHEGPRSYSARLLASAATLTQEQKRAIKNFLIIYEAARYRPLEKSALPDVLSKLTSLLKKSR
jgi:transglutaminase-like putative cysteine protease